MCKVLILLFIIIIFIKNPENAPNLLALDHHLPLSPTFGLYFDHAKKFFTYSFSEYTLLYSRGFFSFKYILKY